MHFDDRLATVLNLPVRSEALAWVQYRQLLDILGKWTGEASAEGSAAVDAAFARLETLGRQLAPARRAAILSEPGVRIANPDLLASLVCDAPDVAAAAIRASDLEEAQWLALIPALPVRARGILRHRRDLPGKAVALLERLGITDRGLPAAQIVAPAFEAEPLDLIEPLEPSAPEPAGATAPQQEPEPVTADRRGENVVAFGLRPVPRAPAEPGIGDIVRRIEEFRAIRDSKAAAGPQPDHPRLPLDDMHVAPASGITSFDFSTDVEGRVDWADAAVAPMVIGLAIAQDDTSPAGGRVRDCFRTRQPLRDCVFRIEGAAAITGDWRIDASPRFEGVAGHFAGYLGRARRTVPQVADASAGAGRDSEHDRMRQVLHELRTPANAIQFAAGFIQQEMGGALAHDYRALAATILGDIAQILAGFDELDRLVRLESGALSLGSGPCDIMTVVQSGIARLSAWSQSKGSGFELSGPLALPAAIDPGDAEQLMRRILAAMAWHSAPGEVLPIDCREAENSATVTIGLPAALSDPSAWVEALAPGNPSQAESSLAGRFGLGFTFRLAQAEAAGMGGSLERGMNAIKLTLPCLTAPARDHSDNLGPQSASSSA